MIKLTDKLSMGSTQMKDIVAVANITEDHIYNH